MKSLSRTTLKSLLRVSSLRQGAIALLVAILVIVSFETPAQASWLDRLRSFFSGDTGEGAQGNVRGGAIRDRRCGAEDPRNNPLGQGNAPSTVEASVEASTSSVGDTEQLVLLAPNTGTTLITTEAAPEVFVYIASSLPSEVQSRSLQPKSAAIARQTPNYRSKIDINDINDIDSIVEEAVQDQIEQIQGSQLLLELQFNGATSYYSIPDNALIAKLQAPPNTTFEVGATSALEVRLICRHSSSSSLSSTSTVESNDVIESEVFVEVQRVPSSNALATDLATHQADNAYQAYLEHGLWFEMVASLAANPNSPEWTTLLEELEIPQVAPTPQVLVPVSSAP